MKVLRFALIRLCWNEATFAVRMMSSVLLVLLALSGKASADDFIFNGTVSPMTGTYLPVGGGHYNNSNPAGSAESFYETTTILATAFLGLDEGDFLISQGRVPYDPSSPQPCFFLSEDTCYNSPVFFDASDGSPLCPRPACGTGIAIYDQAGDLLALMIANYPVDAGDVRFYSGIGGAPISQANAAALNVAFDYVDDPSIARCGGYSRRHRCSLVRRHHRFFLFCIRSP